MIGALSLGGYNDIVGNTAKNHYKTKISTKYVNSLEHEYTIKVTRNGLFEFNETIANKGNVALNNYISEYKKNGYSTNEENYVYNDSTTGFALYTSSFRSEKQTSKIEWNDTDVSTYLTINLSYGGLLASGATVTSVSIETGTETFYTGTTPPETFIQRNQVPTTNFKSKVTYFDFEFSKVDTQYGGMNVSFSTYNLSGLNFKQSSVYTENSSTTYSQFNYVENSGNDSYLDVSYGVETLRLGAYFDTDYVIGTCETVYTATWQRNADGETNLFRNVFNNAGRKFLVKAESVKQQVIRETF